MVDPVTQPTTTTPPPPTKAGGTGNTAELVKKLDDLGKTLGIRKQDGSVSEGTPDTADADTTTDTHGNAFSKFTNSVSGTIGEFLSKILEKQIKKEEEAEETRKAERKEEAEEEEKAGEARDAEEKEEADKAEAARAAKEKEEEAAAKKAEEAAAAKKAEEEKKLDAVVKAQRALISAISKDDPDAIQTALASLKSLPSVNLPENVRAQYKSELDSIVAKLKTMQAETRGRATLENLKLAYTSFLEGKPLNDNVLSLEEGKREGETTGA